MTLSVVVSYFNARDSLELIAEIRVRGCNHLRETLLMVSEG